MKLNRQPLSLFSIGMKWETRRGSNIEFSQWNSTHTFSTRGSATEIHWGNSVFNGFNFAPHSKCHAGCCAQLGVFHKTRMSTFKIQQNDNDWSWAASFSDMQKRQTQTQSIILRCFSTILSVLCSKSLKLEGETQKNYPHNVSCKYVCLHFGCFIALNISVGSYIKHSLYSKLPFIYLFILPRASSGLYNSMLSILALHYLWTQMQTCGLRLNILHTCNCVSW